MPDSRFNQVNTVSNDLYLKAFGSKSDNLAIPASILAQKSILSKTFDPLNILNTCMQTWRGMINTGGSGTSTWSLICKAPAPYTRVRMLHKGLDAVPGSVTGALVAPTANATDKVTPTVGSGLTNDAGATGWSQVTYNSGAVTTITLPTPGTDSRDAGLIYSDWIDLESVAPDDGTRDHYLMARLRFSGNFSYWYLGGTTMPSLIDNTKSTYHVVYNQNVDGITTPTNMTLGGSTVQGNSPFFGFEFQCSERVIRVLCVGDSITVGQGSDNSSDGPYSWVARCEDYFRANSIPINMISYAWGGSTTSQYSIFGKTAASTLMPSACIYSVFSPNDGTPTAAITATQYRRAMDFAYYCLSYGVTPIFSFLAPKDDYTAANDTLRKALIARCQASGILTIDASGAISAPGNPSRFVDGRKYDSTHPNDTGYAEMYPVVRDALIDMVSNQFTY